MSPGAETNIAIDRTLITIKPAPYSDCIQSKTRPDSKTNPYIDLTFKTLGFYSKPTCLQLCYQHVNNFMNHFELII